MMIGGTSGGVPGGSGSGSGGSTSGGKGLVCCRFIFVILIRFSDALFPVTHGLSKVNRSP